MVSNIPTRGEMERNLSQSIQAFYRNQLGCRTGKISCHIIERQVAIAILNPITPVERLLNDDETDDNFVSSLRYRIDRVLKQQLPFLIESILGVEITGITLDTTIENNFTGIIALLENKPVVRELRRANR